MIKSDDSGPTDRSGAKSSKCWHREPTATEIRLETGDNGTFLFPIHQKMFAHLTSADGQDVLTIGFPSHEVKIYGSRLLPVLAALQDSAVEWIKPLGQRFEFLTADNSPFVARVEVSPKELPQQGEA